MSFLIVIVFMNQWLDFAFYFFCFIFLLKNNFNLLNEDINIILLFI